MVRIEVTRRAAALGAAALGLGAATGAHGASAWSAGEVAHLIPTAGPNALLIVASLKSAVAEASLFVGEREVPGNRTDSAGRHWRFHADKLRPGTTYTLRLAHADRPLCDPWALRTLPDPDAAEPHFRLLAFTCAGGWEGLKMADGTPAFRPLALRRRLLARGLSFSPDAVVAIGDHVYWDLTSWKERSSGGAPPPTLDKNGPFGAFDMDLPIYGTPNEEVVRRIGEAQIGALYGTMLKGVPSYFVADDHDYFDNDVANAAHITFPPETFNVNAQRTTAALFYPPLLGSALRPAILPGGADEIAPGANDCFGTLRWGRLCEALIYDCARFLTLKGPFAGLVPPEAERWLLARTQTSDARALLHIPSHPMGWSAGKWREWYPDILADSKPGVPAHLTTEVEKYFWQKGWNAQHQRLLAALAARGGASAVVSGDLHAVGWGRIRKSYDLDLGAGVTTVLSGPISTDGPGFPSTFRGVSPQVPDGLVIAEPPPAEKNGFAIVDVVPGSLTFRLFAWRDPDPVDAIDTLEPFDVVTVPVAG
ncbi:MAG: hypothetical protein H6923_06135 [Alphaproteobacteria bacterium]|nr:hypothetical protein [Alphaproteobacteria bacterium]